jgi:hypothetical protein
LARLNANEGISSTTPTSSDAPVPVPSTFEEHLAQSAEAETTLLFDRPSSAWTTNTDNHPLTTRLHAQVQTIILSCHPSVLILFTIPVTMN